VLALGGPAAAPARGGESGGASASSLDEYVPDFAARPATEAIVAAVDAASSAGGGTVVLPAGPFDLTRDLRLPSHVTLRGMSWPGTVLRGRGGERAVVVDDGAEGVALENLTVPAVRFGASASYCTVRRVRVLDAPGDALVLPRAVARHLSLEQVVVEGCGGDGVVHRAPDASGVFLSEVAVSGFGGSSDQACALRIGGRAQITQLHVEPVRPGHCGVLFTEGSELSSLNNFTMRLDGGDDVRLEPPSLDVAVGVGSVV